MFFFTNRRCRVYYNEVVKSFRYIECEGSRYFNRHTYAEIEEALIMFDVDNVCLMGDFNSRTGGLSDLMTNIEFVDSPFDFNTYDLSERVSLDTQTNTMGYELISFCKSCQLATANGRLKGDNPGKLTCKSASVVDYVLLSHCLFDCVIDFAVLDFNELYSDVHAPINVTFKCSNQFNNVDVPNVNEDIPPDENNDNMYVKWEQEHSGTYENKLNERKIADVNIYLDNLANNKDHINVEHIDDVVSKIKHILIEPAHNLKMLKKKRRRYVKKPNKQIWFKDECKRNQKLFNNARNKDIHSKDKPLLEQTQNKAERKKAAKIYRKTVKKYKRNFDFKFANELRNLKSSDPRKYWNVINRDDKCNETGNQPTCDEFLEMFKQFGNDVNSNNENVENEDEGEYNAFLNDHITVTEVKNNIKSLKSHKAHGLDYIINEFIKCSCDKMSEIFTKLFNVVLDTGIVPSDWVIGVIRPIYKSKGNKSDPNNYRGITLLSCLGKLFTCILNNRIKNFTEESNTLGPEQAGFRKNFSTVDHLFTIYGIIDILLSKRKRLYCAFLDFEKAFVKVERAFLWQKLLDQKVNGKVLKVIKNLYANAKSCVQLNNDISDFFEVNIGVRQGENLSPILFALFLNDLNVFMSNNLTSPESLVNSAQNCGMPEDDVNVFMKLFVLLYADDTILFAETPKDLQRGLDQMKIYCDRWKLKLNARKCKIMIFSRGKVRVHPQFVIGEEIIEVVSDFLYLGMRLNYNNRMKVAQKDMYDRASRAMFSLLKKCKKKNLPVDVTIDMFNKMIVPILTYGCEVWGFTNADIVDRLQLKFLKIVLRLRRSTPSHMIYGETGMYPIALTIKNRIMNYWVKLVSHENRNKLSSIVYKFLYKLYRQGEHESLYLKYVRDTLIDLGLPYLWESHDVTHVNTAQFKYFVKRQTQDLFILEWHNVLAESSMYNNYRIIKSTFGQERYLTILPYNCIISFIRFRTTNNLLPVNVQRYYNIHRDERTCDKCLSNDTADEFHYLFVCPYFEAIREKCIPCIHVAQPSYHKYNHLFNSHDKQTLLKLKHMIDVINKSLSQ